MSTTAIDQAVEAIQADAAEIRDEEPKHPLHRELNASDRCESWMRLQQYGAENGPCGSQAFYLAVIAYGEERKEADLVFCAHHFTKSEAKLREKAVYISDQSDKINIKASASSPDPE